MANNFSLAYCFHKLSLLLLWCVPLLALIAFSDLNVYWVNDAYDGWRIFQIILLMMFSIYAIFIRPHNTSVPQSIYKTLSFTISILLGSVIISCWQTDYSARAAADAALYALLAISVWAQADLFRKNPTNASFIAAWIAVLPLFVVISLFIGISLTITGVTGGDWHRSFSNIRMLDDALLPCLFLLWQRPAWLSVNPSKNHQFNRILTCGIYILSASYLLVFWLDGARANMLGILTGLLLIACFRRDQWQQLKLPFFSLISSGIIYTVLINLFHIFIFSPMIRTDSTLRDVLWKKAFQLWHVNPVFGAGGDSFALAEPWIISAHPHNIVIQLISEWGSAGLLTIFLLILIMIQIFLNRKILPAFAMAAVVAFCLNASLSGAFVYPLSQMLGTWSLAWLISLLPSHPFNSNTTTETTHVIKTTSKTPVPAWHTLVKIIAVIAILTMLFVHGKDIFCTDCMSTDNDNAPRFWQYGRALHLVPAGSEAINNTPDALLKNR